MSSKSTVQTDAPKGKSKKKLLLFVALGVLVLGVAGLWFAGLLPIPGLSHPASAAAAHPAGDAPKPAPVFFDLPEIVTNLNSGPRHANFLKLQAKLELEKPEDRVVATAALPRVLDLFQTYLREMRPDELRGSAGTYRLREELIARASLAIAPARVLDVLFVEMLVQ